MTEFVKMYQAKPDDVLEIFELDTDRSSKYVAGAELNLFGYSTSLGITKYGTMYVQDMHSGEQLYTVLGSNTDNVEATKSRFPEAYPAIYAMGLEVHLDHTGPPYVPKALISALKETKGKKFAEQYAEFFGIQTMSIKGPYPWDVESVLKRMTTGKLTGSQLCWD